MKDTCAAAGEGGQVGRESPGALGEEDAVEVEEEDAGHKDILD